MKAVKLLLNERKIDKDIVLLTDEIYLQKELQFQQGKLISCDENGNLFNPRMHTQGQFDPAHHFFKNIFSHE